MLVMTASEPKKTSEPFTLDLEHTFYLRYEMEATPSRPDRHLNLHVGALPQRLTPRIVQCQPYLDRACVHRCNGIGARLGGARTSQPTSRTVAW